MASKEAYVAPPPSNAPRSPCLECSESAADIQHMTHPDCHLCVSIHLCRLTCIRFGKFRLWLKKKTFTEPPDQFSKIN